MESLLVTTPIHGILVQLCFYISSYIKYRGHERAIFSEDIPSMKPFQNDTRRKRQLTKSPFIYQPELILLFKSEGY